jgi:tRNA G18 (ribose-2'-O)-methylase SpoU
LILDRLTDVRNFGAICRTAECVGIDAVIIPEKGAAPINSDAIKLLREQFIILKSVKKTILLMW